MNLIPEREEGRLTLMEAIRRMALLPAQRLDLRPVTFNFELFTWDLGGSEPERGMLKLLSRV